MARAAVVDEPTSTFHISWGAVFGGAFVALGVWILLHALGLALGLTAINPNDTNSLRGIGIGTGIWSVAAPLVALFLGGLVCARLAGVIDRGTGAMHGAVLWGLTAVLGVVLVGMAIGAVVGLGARVGGLALGAAGRGAPQVMSKMNADDALGPINQKLRQQGAPPVTSGQVQAAIGDVLTRALREGKVDRETLINALTANTSLDRADAEQVGGRLESQFDQSLTDVRQGALKAAEATGKALWAVFFALLLGLISSVAGAIVGVSRRQREGLVVAPAAPTPTPTTPSPRPVVERHVPVETTR
jgi:hypothetical protein